METIVYLIKVNVAIVLFYGMYRMLFQQDTFFQWKRIALLSVILTAFLYPVIDISQQLIANPGLKEWMETGLIAWHTLPEVIVTGNTFAAGNPFLFLCGMVYLAVAGLLLARLFVQIGTIIYKVRPATKNNLLGYTVYESPGLETPFSFFRWVVLDSSHYSKTELQEILLHESTHVAQGHSVDTILAELLCVFCWFNPFAWLLKQEIRMNLESLADRSVLTSGCGAEHYQFHLLRLSYHKAAAQISNNFNVSPLKKRIFMMNKQQTSSRSILKYALILPVVASLLFFNCTFHTQAQSGDNTVVQDSVTVSEPVLKTENREVYSHVDDMPRFPGGDRALMQWLSDHINYPEDATKSHIQGRVIVRFVIETDGSINNVELVRGVHPSLDKEAIRVIESMPQWVPGTQNGKPVAVYYTIPIVFKLQEDTAAKQANE